jgi:hypothetical protein
MEKQLTTSATIHIAATSTQQADNQIPGRLLPSLSLTQSQTVKTTGIGHQLATYAHGYISLYNGLLISQVVSAGTIFTGRDGVEIITEQTSVIPPATPPYEGQATVYAHAIMLGSSGNIAGYDINIAISSSILAKNTTSFYGGLDARTYPMVVQADIDSAVSHLKPSLAQSIQGAFTTQLVSGEALITLSYLRNDKDEVIPATGGASPGFRLGKEESGPGVSPTTKRENTVLVGARLR